MRRYMITSRRSRRTKIMKLGKYKLGEYTKR